MAAFRLDGETDLIRTLDLLEAAKRMAHELGMNAEVRALVGKWENGQLTGWEKRANAEADLVMEVFVSKRGEERREAEHYAREMQALLDENAALKGQLAEREAVTA